MKIKVLSIGSNQSAIDIALISGPLRLSEDCGGFGLRGYGEFGDDDSLGFELGAYASEFLFGAAVKETVVA